MSNRKKMAVMNVFSAIMYYVANSIIGFINRKVFTVYLGSELLGLNGLVVSVISMLSLLELGVASSIGYSLYKPLEEKNYGEVKAIMQLFSRLYRYIGIAVAVIGLVLIPFLLFFVRTTIDQNYVIAVYLIFLLDAVLSYFMAYRRTIIVSAQKDYINKNADTFLYIVTGILQIIIICVWKSYIASLIVKLIFTVLNNLYLYIKAGKMFPYLNDKNLHGEIEKEVKDKIVYNVKALFVIKIASYCVVGTDNILLSAFADLTAVAIYSGYTLIIGIINNLFNRSFGYITANIGNYLIGHNKEEIYQFYNKLNFLNYLITSYTSIALLVLLNEFIGKVWLGEDYVFPMAAVAVLVFNNYLRFCTQAAEAFRSAAGLYSPKPFVKYIALLEGGVNLVVSVALAYFAKMGIYGIFLGTSVSTTISIASIAWINYRFLFEKKVHFFYLKFFWYMLWAIISGCVSVLLFKNLYTRNVLFNIILGLVVSFVIPLGVNYLVFGRSVEWRYFIDMLKGIFHKVMQKVKKQ